MACAERSLGRSEAPDSSEGLKGPDSGDRIAQALKASFKDLDAQILAEEQKQGVEKGAFGGCTAVVALAMGDVSRSANISANCTVICIGMVCCLVFHVQKQLFSQGMVIDVMRFAKLTIRIPNVNALLLLLCLVSFTATQHSRMFVDNAPCWL